LAAGRHGAFIADGIVEYGIIWYSAAVDAAGFSQVNRKGTTRFRLRFTIDDNDNSRGDYVTFFSGNAAAAKRPRLMVNYCLPNK
jgi:hypothetical protein